jgi:uroporphyrinogen-III decarboxylase
MPEAMTDRERWLAALKCEPVDRLPFWAKIGGSYPPYQTEPFRSMSVGDIHKWVGSNPPVGSAAPLRVVRKKTSTKSFRENGTNITKYITPAGTLTAARKYDEGSRSWHPVEFPVKRREDIEAMTLFFSDAVCEFDSDQLDQALATVERVGENGVVTTGIGVSPLMDWIQHLAGIENAHFMLWDYREDVENLFEAMHALLCRRAEIIAEKSPAPVVFSTENTSTTLISPAMFRRYCYKHLLDYGNILSSAGKLHLLHMCGHLKDVLSDISKLPAVGIEAFTSPTLGNTTLKDGRTACLNQCLVGGTNATLWTKSKEVIFSQIKHDLDELPHHRGIVLTSAGVMTPLCKPETIKAVADLVKSYPVSNN